MYKLFLLPLLLICFSACSAKYSHFAGDYVHSKKNKDIMASKEILITSLFVATSHVPEEVKTYIGFFEHGKTSLSKEAKSKITEFAAGVLAYEDYFITVEGHEDASEAGVGEVYNKISNQRAEAVKKALIKCGVDKDKIEAMGVGISKPAHKGETEEFRKQNRRVVIEAELW